MFAGELFDLLQQFSSTPWMQTLDLHVRSRQMFGSTNSKHSYFRTLKTVLSNTPTETRMLVRLYLLLKDRGRCELQELSDTHWARE